MNKKEKINASLYEYIRSGHLLNKRFETIKELIYRTYKDKGKIGEFGCGTGNLSYLLSRKFISLDFEASDINETFINYAKEKHKNKNLRFFISDVEKINISNKYNTVITVDLLHHVTNIKKTIYNIRKSLIDGGHWIIVEPNVYDPYIFLLQKFMEDESIFLQNKFEQYIKKYFVLVIKQNRVLIPHFIKNPPKILTFIESKFETLPFFGGDVVYLLKTIN